MIREVTGIQLIIRDLDSADTDVTASFSEITVGADEAEATETFSLILENVEGSNFFIEPQHQILLDVYSAGSTWSFKGIAAEVYPGSKIQRVDGLNFLQFLVVGTINEKWDKIPAKEILEDLLDDTPLSLETDLAADELPYTRTAEHVARVKILKGLKSHCDREYRVEGDVLKFVKSFDAQIGSAWKSESGLTEYTTEINSDTECDVPIFDIDSIDGEFWFGCDEKFGGLTIDVCQVGYHGELDWYYMNASGAHLLSNVLDDTIHLIISGSNTVRWDLPGDWTKVDPSGARPDMYWVYAVIKSGAYPGYAYWGPNAPLVTKCYADLMQSGSWTEGINVSKADVEHTQEELRNLIVVYGSKTDEADTFYEESGFDMLSCCCDTQMRIWIVGAKSGALQVGRKQRGEGATYDTYPLSGCTSTAAVCIRSTGGPDNYTFVGTENPAEIWRTWDSAGPSFSLMKVLNTIGGLGACTGVNAICGDGNGKVYVACAGTGGMIAYSNDNGGAWSSYDFSADCEGDILDLWYDDGILAMVTAAGKIVKRDFAGASTTVLASAPITDSCYLINDQVFFGKGTGIDRIGTEDESGTVTYVYDTGLASTEEELRVHRLCWDPYDDDFIFCGGSTNRGFVARVNFKFSSATLLYALGGAVNYECLSDARDVALSYYVFEGPATWLYVIRADSICVRLRPIKWTAQNDSHIARFGERGKKVVDRDLTTVRQAEGKATGLLNALCKTKITSIKIDTGFDPEVQLGRRTQIDLPSYGVSGSDLRLMKVEHRISKTNIGTSLTFESGTFPSYVEEIAKIVRSILDDEDEVEITGLGGGSAGVPGLWESDGSTTKLMTAEDVDLQGEKFYLNKGNSDSGMQEIGTTVYLECSGSGFIGVRRT